MLTYMYNKTMYTRVACAGYVVVINTFNQNDIDLREVHTSKYYIMIYNMLEFQKFFMTHFLVFLCVNRKENLVLREL